MKIMLLSYMDNLGAGNAAMKIYEMLKKNNIETDLFVKKKFSKNSKQFRMKKFNDISHEIIYDTLNLILNKLINNKFTANEFRSLGWFQSPYTNIINKSDFDIVQLNWINNFISIKDIGKITKPLVWRFSDMWPILGTKHYSNIKNEKETNLFSIGKYLENLNIKKKKTKLENKDKCSNPKQMVK